MVGTDVEAEMFHWRARYVLEPCLRTTPEIKSKTNAGLPKPDLKSAAQLLKLIIEETKKVRLDFDVSFDVIIIFVAWPVRN